MGNTSCYDVEKNPLRVCIPVTNDFCEARADSAESSSADIRGRGHERDAENENSDTQSKAILRLSICERVSSTEEDDHEYCNDEFPPISLDYENPFQCRQQPSDSGVLEAATCLGQTALGQPV